MEDHLSKTHKDRLSDSGLGVKERTWYDLDLVEGKEDIDNDTLLTLHQALKAYQQLQVTLQSANSSKVRGKERILDSMADAMEVFLGRNGAKIRKV